MNVKVLVLALPGIALFQGCDPDFDKLWILNNSGETIYRFYTCADTIERLPELRIIEYTDSSGHSIAYDPIYKINPGESKPILLWGLRGFINSCDNNTLKIFIINESTMSSHSWDDIWKNQLFAKKIEVTVGDLEENDWVFTFSQ